MKMRLTPDKDAFLVKQMELYNEYELISHSKLADCTMFIVDMVYRPMHLHKELELCVVLSGSCRVSTDRQSFEAGPGEILLFDAGSSHELCASGAPARLLTLQISDSFCARFYPQIRCWRFPIICATHRKRRSPAWRRSTRSLQSCWAERHTAC